MYRLLAMDLDGTLLMRDGSIPDVLAERLRGLNSEGIATAVCTGRVGRSAGHYSKMIGGTAYAAFNGSEVRTAEGRILRKEIPEDTVREVVDFCYGKEAYIQLYRGDTILVDRFVEELGTDQDIRFTDYEELGDLRRTELGPSPKMIMVELSDRMPQLAALMRERFPELTVTESSRYVVEIMPRGTDKGTGLRTIAEDLGIGPEETVAIGDSMNDLPMLRWAGKGIAVANANPGLKVSADAVTEREMSYGVLEAVDMLFS